MNIVLQVIIGLLMIGAGTLILKYNYQVANTIHLGFAEKYLGTGGSFGLWKVLAVLIVLAGLTVVFGFFDNILEWVLSPLTNILSV